MAEKTAEQFAVKTLKTYQDNMKYTDADKIFRVSRLSTDDLPIVKQALTTLGMREHQVMDGNITITTPPGRTTPTNSGKGIADKLYYLGLDFDGAARLPSARVKGH